MSVWNIGIDDESEETRIFKDKLSSKESQISAQQMKLMKQTAELDELQSTLNDALHKLSRETNRVLQLESDLTHRSEELRNEKLVSQNAAQALAAAQEKIKLKELDARDLQANLESLSHTSDSHNARRAKLERDKSTLEARVRELEVNLQQLSSPPSVPEQRTGPRPRSSSLSGFRITSLQQEVHEVRELLSQKEKDLWTAKQSLSQAQSDLMRVGNEKEAVEKKATRELAELRSSLEQKEDELQYWMGQQDNGSREEELMKRVEEDEAKIMMLEKLLGDTQDSLKLREKLEKAEERFKHERKRRSEYEDRQVELAKEKEDALEELEHARDEISRLSGALKQRDTQWNALNADMASIDASTKQLPPMLHEGYSHIERLLVAVERLREERDNFQRDMHFLESESKFAIDALKAKLTASPPSGFGDEAEAAKTITQLKAEIDALRGQITAVVAPRSGAILAKDRNYIERLVLAATASAVVVEHLGSQLDHLERRVFDTCHSRTEVEERLKSSQKRAVELEEEVGEVKCTLRETCDSFEQSEMHLANVSKALEDAESERDSLALQITNLSTDLRVAQEELANAEHRYSSLQSHQLSSMSSNEATRLLRDQIGELEMRVIRRTEQIGIHQHDIKRLETNLRLQEERLGEMTTELEMMAAQKDAMVEDCADAREARDEALARLDRMEVDMEMRMEESDKVAAALVAVVFETVSRSRNTSSQLDNRTRKAEEEVDRLDAVHEEILDQNCMLLDALRSSYENAQQSMVALAVSHIALHNARTRIHTLQQGDGHLNHELKNVQDDLLEERTKTASLRKQLETEDQASNDAIDFSARILQLEANIIALQNEISSAEVVHQSVIDELTQTQERLRKSLDKAHVDGSPENELANVKARHAEELEAVQLRLVETSTVLKELQTRYAAAETEHHRALLDASETKQELERLLANASESLRQTLHEKQETDQVQKKTLAEVSRLHSELDVALTNAQNAQKSREELQTLYDNALNELAQIRQSHDTHIASLTDRSLDVRQELEGKLADLQSRFDEQSGQLDDALQETSRLAQKLQESSEQLSAVKESHQKELYLLGQHHREMSIAKSQLEQSRVDLETLREEKLSLQEEITTVEAELQRSISLRRFLESQAQDSERKIESLTHDLERMQADLARSEKSAKAAEVNLSLRGAQHKREMADLQRELTLLRSQPNLTNAISELEERNNEMEELLRVKCVEIEENDDRALEMLKENKKLASRVESLTRKVQNLQSKLAAAKAAVSRPEPSVPNDKAPPTEASPTPSYDAPRAPLATSDVPPVSSIPTQPPSSIIRAPSHRIASGPSSLSWPKTPERSVPSLPPVFKARTPERRVASAAPPDVTPSAITFGKKRPAPDDFENCESVPPQGFTADSLPSRGPENEAPRVKRVFQTGFTPVRHSARPTVPLPSPKRPVVNSARSSPLIADVTNSPRAVSQMMTGQSGKPSKRSWLGKIRGVSTQANGRDTRC